MRDYLEKAGVIVIQFSGGKDSLACLEYCKDFKHKAHVMWVDTGDAFPHVKEFIEQTCAEYGYSFIIAKPERSVKEWRETLGYPSPIVPVFSSKHLGHLQDLKKKPSCLVQAVTDCCKANIWDPLMKTTLDLKPDVIVRGSKGTDDYVSAGPVATAGNLTFVCPFWDYTDEQVMVYLSENSVRLPHQYTVGCVNSLDCMGCTGWVTSEGERQRLAYTREYYPEEFQTLKSHADKVQAEVSYRLMDLLPCYKELQC